MKLLEMDKEELIAMLEKKVKELRNPRQFHDNQSSSKPPRSPQYQSQKPSQFKKEAKDEGHRHSAIQEIVNATKKYIGEIREDIIDEIENVVAGKSKIIFDTQQHGWNMESFMNMIQGKSKVLLTVFDERKRVFGVFLNEPITINQWVNDSKLFLLSYTPGSRRTLFYSMLKYM